MSFSINLVRIDDRLIHGQIVTRWIQEANADSIIIVDDYLSKNSYLSRVFKMAAPSTIKVQVLSTRVFTKKKNDNAIESGRYIILFKSVSALKSCYDNGFFEDKIQVGGIGSNAERKLVLQSVALSEKEAKQLLEIQQRGVKIFFQRVPDEKKVALSEIIKRHFKNLINN